jgi:glycosyltransferase involved in cell wall biosynthesis
VDRAGKIEMLDSIDVFSVPTTYPEAKGIYVLEALSRGVPVVLPEHGSFPELIEQTGGGVLVPPKDPLALAEALAELLLNPNRRTELGRAGREAVRAGFTKEKMASNYARLCESAIASRQEANNAKETKPRMARMDTYPR